MLIMVWLCCSMLLPSKGSLTSYIMLIYVDAPSGRRTGVSLRPSETVGDLKVRIEDEEWIPQGTIIQLHEHEISQVLINCMYR